MGSLKADKTGNHHKVDGRQWVKTGVLPLPPLRHLRREIPVSPVDASAEAWQILLGKEKEQALL
jgi:hypothetical protein